MANETIGTCECFICGIDAEVRKNRKGKLYLYCPDCGMIQPNLKGAQAHIEKRMKPVPDPVPDPEPTPEKDDLDAMWE